MKRSLIVTAMLAVWLCLLACVTSFSAFAPVEAEPVCMTAPVAIEAVPTTHMAPPTIAEAMPVVEIEENDQADSDEEAETEIMYYTEEEVVMSAKLLWHECRGVKSQTEKACVLWTVCNRVDSDQFDGDTIAEVMTMPDQFAYADNTEVWDELYDLALDVLSRWNMERNGETSVGRVLPPDYFWYGGDGVHNYFRDAYRGNFNIWDYSIPTPYES